MLISKIEWKCETDEELAPYVHNKEVYLSLNVTMSCHQSNQ